MPDEQIRILLWVTGDEARILLDQGEYDLYKDMQSQMVELVREYEVRLPLNCLQFLYCVNEYALIQQPDMDTAPPC